MAGGRRTKGRFVWPKQKIMRMCMDAVVQGVNEVNIELQAGLIENLSQSGSGKHYKGNRAPSSAPGEPPVAQTGHLRLSWTAGNAGHYNVKAQGRRVTSRYGQISVGSALKYARALEKGNPKNNLLPRPYIKPLVDAFNDMRLPTQIVQRHVDEMLVQINQLTPRNV